MASFCRIEPVKITDSTTGLKVESPLYAQLKLMFPKKIAYRIYNRFANKDNISKYMEEFPGSFVLDLYGQPTIESVMLHPDMERYIAEYGLGLSDRVKKANEMYSIGKLSTKGKVLEGTKSFQEVANVIGAVHRDKPCNGNVTVRVHKEKVKGEWVYAVEIVPKTSENVALLQKFIDGCIGLNKMKIIFAKAGIGSEIVDNLSEDVNGLFDPVKPKRILGSIFNLIKLNRNIFKDGGKIVKGSKLLQVLYEEMGHVIIEMFRNNPSTRDTYLKLVNNIISELKKNPNMFYKFNNLLSAEQIQLVINMNPSEVLSKLVEEILGKIMGTIIAFRGESSDTLLPKLFRSINRVLTKGKNVFNNILNDKLFLVDKAINNTTKFFTDIATELIKKKGLASAFGIDASGVTLYDFLPTSGNNTGLLKHLNAAERKFSDSVYEELNKVFSKFLGGEFTVEDALKTTRKLNNVEITQSSLIENVSLGLSNFYKAIDSMGYKLFSTLRNFDVKKTHHELITAYQVAFNSGSTNKLRRGAAMSKFLMDSFIDVKDIIMSMLELLELLDSGFKDACELIKKSISGDPENPSYKDINALELAINIVNLDKQISIINKAGYVTKYISNIIDVFNADIDNSEIEDDLKLELKNIVEDNIRKGVAAIQLVYNMYNRAALTLKFGTINNGKLYIDRGARYAKLGSYKLGKGDTLLIKKSLTIMEERQIPIYKLLEELKVEDGYFDMTLYGHYLQSAGNSIDPITQFIDKITKTNKFKANTENARWHKAIIDFRSFCRDNNVNVSKFFEIIEVDGKAEKTGNIVSNINWGLWEHDLEQYRRKIKATIIAINRSKIQNENWESLSENIKQARIDEIVKSNDFSEWNNLPESEQIKYAYLYGIKLTLEFHRAHSVNINNININEDVELLPESLKQYNPDTRKYEVSYIKTQYSKPNEVVDEVTGQLFITDLLFEDDTNTNKWVPNLLYDNGRYRNYAYDELTSIEKEALQKYLNLKAELDAKLNRYLKGSAVLHRMPLFRGTTTNRIFTEGFGSTLVNSAMEIMFRDAEDLDFGNINTINDEESSFINSMATSSLEMRERLPMYGVNKLKKMNLLTTDIYRGLLSYAIMANNVEAMSNTAPLALLTKQTLYNRKIEGISEKQRHDTIGIKESHIYRRYAAYVEMQIFGKYTSNKASTTVGGKVIAWDKLLKKLSALSSWQALAGNFLGGNVNTMTGIINIFKEAGVKEHFNKEHLIQAFSIYTGHSALSPVGSKLWHEDTMRKFIAYWDCVNKNSQKYSDFDTFLPRILQMNIEMCHYENGDLMMHVVPYIAKALATTLYKRKVGQDGKVTYEEAGNAWDIFVKNCERMKDSELIKATTSKKVVDEEGQTKVQLTENVLSMNPYAYIEEVYDPETNQNKKVVKYYCTRTTKFSLELQQNKHINKDNAYLYRDKLKKLKSRIDALINEINNIIESEESSAYKDLKEYKQKVHEIKLLCSLYNKYELLYFRAVSNKLRWSKTFKQEINTLSFDLGESNDAPVSIREHKETVTMSSLKDIKFGSNRFPDVTTISESDLDYNIFNPEGQASWQDTCRWLCDNLHGIYNNLDGVVASLTGVGAAFLTMKKFYLGYINNLFLTSRDNIVQGTDVEGCIMAYYKIIRLALSKEGFYRGALNQEGKKTNSAIIKSAATRSAALAHLVLSTASPFLAVAGGPITGPLMQMVSLYALNLICQKTNLIMGGATSVMSVSLVNALKRAYQSFKTLAIWRMIGLLVGNAIGTIFPGEDDKKKFEFYGTSDPRLLYPEIYTKLKYKIGTYLRDSEGHYDENGELKQEYLDEEVNSQKEIWNNVEILTQNMSKEEKDKYIAVAGAMIFSNSANGKYLLEELKLLLLASYFKEDELCLKLVAGVVHNIFPSVTPEMFDNYANKMASISKINDDKTEVAVPGLLRYLTVRETDLNYINSLDDSQLIKLMQTGELTENELRIIKSKNKLINDVEARENIINNNELYTQQEQENKLLNGLSNYVYGVLGRKSLDTPIFTKQHNNNKDLVGTEYLLDLVNYFSSRLLIELQVLSPGVFLVNSDWMSEMNTTSTDENARDTDKYNQISRSSTNFSSIFLEAKKLVQETWISTFMPIAASSVLSALLLLSVMPKEVKGYNINFTNTLEASELSNLTSHEKEDLSKVQRWVLDAVDTQYNMFNDRRLLDLILRFIEPTHTRINNIVEPEKTLKTYHLMRMK